MSKTAKNIKINYTKLQQLQNILNFFIESFEKEFPHPEPIRIAIRKNLYVSDQSAVLFVMLPEYLRLCTKLFSLINQTHKFVFFTNSKTLIVKKEPHAKSRNNATVRKNLKTYSKIWENTNHLNLNNAKAYWKCIIKNTKTTKTNPQPATKVKQQAIFLKSLYDFLKNKKQTKTISRLPASVLSRLRKTTSKTTTKKQKKKQEKKPKNLKRIGLLNKKKKYQIHTFKKKSLQGIIKKKVYMLSALKNFSSVFKSKFYNWRRPDKIYFNKNRKKIKIKKKQNNFTYLTRLAHSTTTWYQNLTNLRNTNNLKYNYYQQRRTPKNKNTYAIHLLHRQTTKYKKKTPLVVLAPEKLLFGGVFSPHKLISWKKNKIKNHPRILRIKQIQKNMQLKLNTPRHLVRFFDLSNSLNFYNTTPTIAKKKKKTNVRKKRAGAQQKTLTKISETYADAPQTRTITIVKQRRYLQKQKKKTAKYLNFFLKRIKTSLNKQKKWEMYFLYRVVSRFWPTPQKTNIALEKRKVDLTTLKKKYIKNLSIYKYNTLENLNKTSLNTLSFKINNPKATPKPQTHYIGAKNKNKTSQTKTKTYDMFKRFIKTFWTAQQVFKDKFKPKKHWNRWKFKHKFWAWYKKLQKNDNKKLDLFSTLPKIWIILVKLRLVLSKNHLERLLALNLFLINNTPVKDSSLVLTVGDIIQVPLSLGFFLIKTKKILKRKKAYVREYKRIQYVIKKSQWRQRREKQPNISEYFTDLRYKAIPSWLQFDYFTSSLAVIHKPPFQIKPAYQIKGSSQLVKLTPWRLKI